MTRTFRLFSISNILTIPLLVYGAGALASAFVDLGTSGNYSRLLQALRWLGLGIAVSIILEIGSCGLEHIRGTRANHKRAALSLVLIIVCGAFCTLTGVILCRPGVLSHPSGLDERTIQAMLFWLCLVCVFLTSLGGLMLGVFFLMFARVKQQGGIEQGPPPLPHDPETGHSKREG